MKSLKPQKIAKKEKAERIKKEKKAWVSGDVSNKLVGEFAEELSWFDDAADGEDFFPDENSCKRQLRYWLGWQKLRENAVFCCPKCGRKGATVSKKNEVKNGKSLKRWVFRCKDSTCKDTPSTQAVTMMTGTRTPLRFWFLCIYVVGLMGGKVPWDYLNKRRVGFGSGRDSTTILSRSMANILFIILNECQDIEKRMEYCRLVRVECCDHKTFKGYGDWYKSNSWGWWRIAFRKKSLKKDSLREIITSKDYQDGVRSIYLQKGFTIQPYEWLLIVHINGENKIKNLRWMYISEVKKIDKKKSKAYIERYRYVGIELEEDTVEGTPFKLGKKFKRSFVSSCYDKGLLADVGTDVVVNPSTQLLKELYARYKKIKS